MIDSFFRRPGFDVYFDRNIYWAWLNIDAFFWTNRWLICEMFFYDMEL